MATTTSDPDGIDERLAESVALPGFWDAMPAWSPEAAHRQVQGRLVVWSGAGQVLALSPLASIVAEFFDGRSTLGELAEDLAEAAEVDLADSRTVVASTAIELHDWSLVGGVVATEAATPEEAPRPEVGSYEEVRTDPASGAEVRVVVEVRPDGSTITTEHLPDGRRVITSELSFSTGQEDEAADAAELLASQVLSGDRSAAELVPADSCLGSKLRDGDHVPLVSVRCHDGVVRSVRCHDPEVAELLAVRAGPRLVPGPERGPVEAFVVTPLEGDGPLRVYDGRGHRRGRPRTPADAVAVVDQLLGEATGRRTTAPGAGVPLSMVLVHTASVGVLIDDRAFERPGAVHRLRAAGWTPTFAPAEAHARAQLAVPSMHGDGVRLPVAQTVLWGVADGVEAAELAIHLAGALPAGDAGAVALDRLVELALRLGAPEAGLDGEAAEVRRLVGVE